MDVQPLLKEFAEIAQARAPLASYTLLHVGGSVDVLIRPRSVEELRRVLRRTLEGSVPLHVLGGGGNVLPRDEGVRGAVVLLDAPAFRVLRTDGRRVHAGCGAKLSELIAHAARHNLAGLEPLVGMPGTVGGALRLNAGDRTSDIGQFVRHVEVLDSQAALHTRDHDGLRLGAALGQLDDPILLGADFELEPDQPDAIVKRLRKALIQWTAQHPFTAQAAARAFRNPPGLSAAALIEQAGLVGTRVGKALVSDRNANYVIAEPGAAARDVLGLLDLVRDHVEKRFHVELEPAISVW